mmetsp:Transcript_114726/g.244778  ORF Transcript_114726/g.244778 Transcript_114726/m.244778 type:complete len:308 (+) Transcript_114726:185-1108(+)
MSASQYRGVGILLSWIRGQDPDRHNSDVVHLAAREVLSMQTGVLREGCHRAFIKRTCPCSLHQGLGEGLRRHAAFETRLHGVVDDLDDLVPKKVVCDPVGVEEQEVASLHRPPVALAICGAVHALRLQPKSLTEGLGDACELVWHVPVVCLLSTPLHDVHAPSSRTQQHATGVPEVGHICKGAVQCQHRHGAGAIGGRSGLCCQHGRRSSAAAGASATTRRTRDEEVTGSELHELGSVGGCVYAIRRKLRHLADTVGDTGGLSAKEVGILATQAPGLRHASRSAPEALRGASRGGRLVPRDVIHAHT